MGGRGSGMKGKPGTFEYAMDAADKYLRKMDDVKFEPDFAELWKLEKQLEVYAESHSGDLEFRIVYAKLIYEQERYYEATNIVRDVPFCEEIRGTSLFYNSYPTKYHDWKMRTNEIWSLLRAHERDLCRITPDTLSGTARQAIADIADGLQPFLPLAGLSLGGSEEDGTRELFLSFPAAAPVLPAIEYLRRHEPVSMRRSLSLISGAPGDYPLHGTFNGFSVDNQKTLLLLKDAEQGKLNISFWNPDLRQPLHTLDQDLPEDYLAWLLNYLLSQPAQLAYVNRIIPLKTKPTSSAVFPLTDLRDQMKQRGLNPDLTAEEFLKGRRARFTRSPRPSTDGTHGRKVKGRGKDADSPRTDIVRGETCMPELEKMYFSQDEELFYLLDRFGIAHAFLIIPLKIFPEGAEPAWKKLRKEISLDAGDSIFFTGWAESAKYLYVDYLAFEPNAVLRTLFQFFTNVSGGKDVRVSTFFWDATPRSLDCIREHLKATEWLFGYTPGNEKTWSDRYPSVDDDFDDDATDDDPYADPVEYHTPSYMLNEDGKVEFGKIMLDALRRLDGKDENGIPTGMTPEKVRDAENFTLDPEVYDSFMTKLMAGPPSSSSPGSASGAEPRQPFRSQTGARPADPAPAPAPEPDPQPAPRSKSMEKKIAHARNYKKTKGKGKGKGKH